MWVSPKTKNVVHTKYLATTWLVYQGTPSLTFQTFLEGERGSSLIDYHLAYLNCEWSKTSGGKAQKRLTLHETGNQGLRVDLNQGYNTYIQCVQQGSNTFCKLIRKLVYKSACCPPRRSTSHKVKFHEINFPWRQLYAIFNLSQIYQNTKFILLNCTR